MDKVRKKYTLQDYDYHLPGDLIAQKPAAKRDACRLLVLKKESGEILHESFGDIRKYFSKGDLLVLNDSKVFPARLIGQKEKTGGEVEIFLHRQAKTEESIPFAGNNIWEVLVRGRVRVGLRIIFSGGLEAELVKNNGDGVWLASLNLSGKKFFDLVSKIGFVPLPPYIKREGGSPISDKMDYQTVFANSEKLGSVAAPTAGLHFTNKLLADLKKQGVEIAKITLHVGLGTFAPVKNDDIDSHKMHSEFVMISEDDAQKILATKKSGKRVIAVGTTSCRALESWATGFAGQKNDAKNDAGDISFWTDIFIRPGYQFKIVDSLITNFHLPKSTLLMLVSALAGKDNIEHAYCEAISQKYRFFSYGDAMLII